MADADRLVAALNYLQEQKPADPLESFRSLAGLKDAYERRVQPIINNARQTFSTGGAMGDLLRSYGDAAAPGNAAALQGMGVPFKGPMTAPREEGFSSGENFRPMGDPQQQFAGQLLGDPMNVQPMIAPAARGVVAAGKYAGPELARGLENYMVKSGGILPMDTWHGTPHRFPPTAKNPLGEFDPMKIGTGEGAQAYGAGAGYLAEAKGVAANYRNVLSDTLEVKGQAQPLEKRAAQMALTFGDNTTEGALKWLSKFEGKGANHTSPPMTPELVQQVKQKFSDGTFSHGGSLYKVDLPDEQIAKMLDWNKPLKDQNPAIQKTLQDLVKTDALGRPTGISVDSNINGQWAYERLAGIRGAKYASEAMREAGIPGIRYLDQGSRTGGAGTSNFVVFDPAHMNIIGRE